MATKMQKSQAKNAHKKQSYILSNNKNVEQNSSQPTQYSHKSKNNIHIKDYLK